jgi:hypothetical protein
VLQRLSAWGFGFCSTPSLKVEGWKDRWDTHLGKGRQVNKGCVTIWTREDTGLVAQALGVVDQIPTGFADQVPVSLCVHVLVAGTASNKKLRAGSALVCKAFTMLVVVYVQVCCSRGQESVMAA